jgi:hypothetical protein
MRFFNTERPVYCAEHNCLPPLSRWDLNDRTGDCQEARHSGHRRTQKARTLWVVDRAFIDAAFWERKKRTQGSTLITRMKSNLVVGSRAAMPIAKTPENAGVLRDERITLLSSSQKWRLITLRTRQSRRLEFLTNDFSLLPGVIAFLYARR